MAFQTVGGLYIIRLWVTRWKGGVVAFFGSPLLVLFFLEETYKSQLLGNVKLATLAESE